MSCFIKGLVEVALDFSVTFGRDNGAFPSRLKRFNHAFVGIVRLVSQQRVGLHLGQQDIETFQIVVLASCQPERQRVAQCIAQRVDFGTQTAFAAPDGFVAAVFFRAPALCW